jgi:maltose alpha-D-glucosyltransferase/alpha-amylase
MIDDLWYKNAVFHCLSVGSSMDSDGDGVSDYRWFRIGDLDYLLRRNDIAVPHLQ